MKRPEKPVPETKTKKKTSKAVLATNKLRQRERLTEAGVPQPRYWVVGGEDALPEVALPCVVKAPDQQGQKGLSLVHEAAERGPGAAYFVR